MNKRELVLAGLRVSVDNVLWITLLDAQGYQWPACLNLESARYVGPITLDEVEP